MAEYIERETLMRKIHAKPEADGNKRAAQLLEHILSAPAADVAPVVHGRWKRYGRNLGECPNCGEIVNIRYNYCPNCGARMDL